MMTARTEHWSWAGIIASLLLLLMPLSVPAAQDSPLQLVRETSTRMIAAMQSEQDSITQDPARLYELVEEIVLPNFDFRRMSQWVLGKNWRAATPAQRELFVDEFKVLLVRTYGSALHEYASEELIYLPFTEEPDAKTATVRTEIDQPGIGVIPIYYSMYRASSGWKVYDISISGVSLVTSYRSTYGSIIRREGIDQLIDQLAERNERRADG